MTGGGGKGSGGGSGSSAPPAPKPEEQFDEFFEYTTATEARVWAYKHLGGRKDYPKSLGDAILIYSGEEYHDINAAVRATKGDLSKLDDPDLVVKNKYGIVVNKVWVKDVIERMDQAMSYRPGSPQATTVRRGTSMREFESLGIEPGDDLSKYIGKTYRNNAFTSTSIDTQAAFSSKPVQITIRVPKGTKGVYMSGDINKKDNLSKNVNEQEWLLPRGSKFQIKSAEMVNGRWRVEVVLK